MTSQGTLTDDQMRQFEVTDDRRKHQVMQRQKGDLAMDKDFNAVCYFCCKLKFVTSSVVMLCKTCVAKRGSEYVLGFVKANAYSHCVSCGKMKPETAELSVRTCARCKGKIGKLYEKLREMGDEANPFYKKLRKTQGAEWKMITGLHDIMGDPYIVNNKIEALRRISRK